ncbi:MAG TPA: MBOAT family protein [Bryobacteraceae bacterium]|nr:MBOAT family protein [Bryobacteraceae bacterium]
MNTFKRTRWALTPALRLLIASLGAIYAIKAVALAVRGGPSTASGLAAFLFAWPGVIPVHFRERQAPQAIDPARFLAAWVRMASGAVSIILLAVYAPAIPGQMLGLAGVAALLLTIHLGILDVLPWLLRWAGFAVPLLFDRPWASRSLNEFWSRRWNLAFVEMNGRLFLKPLRRSFGRPGSRFALFALSGLLHELALSWPAGAGWGLPLGCFLLHGALTAIEERFRIVNRAWTWFWLIAPSPWLFHEPFRRTLIVPLYFWLHRLISHHPWDWYLSLAIYAAALGQLVVPIASFQVPARLGWKEDIPKLTRFNQKVFWVYAFYILLSIVSFSVLTWRLHDEFLAGELAARWIAGFIAVFWTVRVLLDVFWYDHRDWPAGNELVAGHALLTSLFCTLAAVYWFTALVPAR